MSRVSAVVRIDPDRLLQRFLRYVRIGTNADPASATYPSTSSQHELGAMLCAELKAMSVEEAHQDEHSLVWGTLPGTVPNAPTVALVAHVDTSPESPGDNVHPNVIEVYEGGDILLESGEKIEVASTPSLPNLIGKTLITTDGTTLLGGDDKAGVAIIMELAQTLMDHPELKRGPVRILFTCDEEIGRGTDKIDLAKVDAMVAYTIDGGGSGVIDEETFSADACTVRFTGHNIHPAIAKDRMVSALRAVSDFVAQLPRDHQTPETTEHREGFIHPHTIAGGVGEASVELILRSFDATDLDTYATQIKTLADSVVSQTPGLSVEVTRKRQYRNLKDGLEHLPESIDLAVQAYENLGRPATKEIIRGGTDGSQLTEKGLPTPNLSSGQHNIHAVTEFACLDEMVEATEHLVELLALWSEHRT